MKWKIRITFGVIVYIAIHAVVTIVDNRQVIDRTEITSKKEYDGPLLMKDFDNENAHIIRFTYLWNEAILNIYAIIYALNFFVIFLWNSRKRKSVIECCLFQASWIYLMEIKLSKKLKSEGRLENHEYCDWMIK